MRTQKIISFNQSYQRKDYEIYCKKLQKQY